MKKVCEVCGSDYETRSRSPGRERFCSKPCYRRFWNRKTWQKKRPSDPEPRDCEICGNPFTPDRYHPGAKTCSKSCNAARMLARKSVFRPGPRECEICGNSFTPDESHSWAKTCSPRCSGVRGNQISTDQRAIERERQGALDKRPCPECGEIFVPNKRNWKNQKYCSMLCTQRVAGRVYIHRYPERHKSSKARGRWGGNHKAALERDDRKCQICDSGEKLHVHHIDDSGETDQPNHELDNLATLCGTCHRKVHVVSWRMVGGEMQVYGLMFDWMKIDTVKVVHGIEEA